MSKGSKIGKKNTKGNLKSAEPHLQAIAQMWVDAEKKIKQEIVEQFGFTATEADTIFAVYVHKKIKAMKYSVGAGRYLLTHGIFWEKEPMQNAIAIASEILN